MSSSQICTKWYDQNLEKKKKKKSTFPYHIYSFYCNFVVGKLNILKLYSESNENIGQICKLIEVHKLGLTLSNCLQNIEGKDLMSAYIHDFLCMDYPVCSDNELEVSYSLLLFFN